MDGDVAVYDLGEVEEQRPREGQPEVTRRRPARRVPASRSPIDDLERDRSRRAWLVGVAIFVPGGSHLLRWEFRKGFAILGLIGLFGALAWAILETLERLVPTLGALGLPTQGGLWALLVLYVGAAVTHVAGVISAAPGPAAPVSGNFVHPVTVGLASALVPGWGQALAGHRKSAALFLSVCWLVAGAWILASSPVQGLLDRYALHLPAGLALLSSPFVRWTGPLLLWILAVYDASIRAARQEAR